MKKLIAALLVLATSASMAKPICGEIGSRSEGWYGESGDLIQYDNCKGLEAKCLAVGTRSEGWYAIDTHTGEKQWLIEYGKCNLRFSTDEFVKPKIGLEEIVMVCEIIEICTPIIVKIWNEAKQIWESTKTKECKKEKVCTPANNNPQR